MQDDFIAYSTLMLFIFCLCILLPLTTGAITTLIFSRKNLSLAGGFALGALVGLPGILIALFLPSHPVSPPTPSTTYPGSNETYSSMADAINNDGDFRARMEAEAYREDMRIKWEDRAYKREIEERDRERDRERD